MLLLLVLISLLHNVQSLNFGDPDEDYPWFLALQERQNSSLPWTHFCTAVVLSEKYRLVIMPAHCLFTRGQNGWKDIKVKNKRESLFRLYLKQSRSPCNVILLTKFLSSTLATSSEKFIILGSWT